RASSAACWRSETLPGMVDQAVADHHFDPARAFMIGDKEVDVELGLAVGATTFLVRTGHGAKFVEGTKADHLVDDLAAAVKIIEKSVRS
ncbi:MAG: HAD hydrolase-like protein, partial [Rhodospirillaceae bacterium]|nr:HAD hydrolase-like protein [Rhodospirillaceae bacterium]